MTLTRRLWKATSTRAPSCTAFSSDGLVLRGKLADGEPLVLLLTAEFRRAESNGYDLDTLIPRLVAKRGLANAVDVGAVLISRLHHATAQPRRAGRHRITPRLIVGLVPIAVGPVNAEDRQALDERQHHMEQRAVALIEQATTDREPWLTSLGAPPEAPEDGRRWLAEVRIIVAYRDRYGITGPQPLGPPPANDTQRLDRARGPSRVATY